jgi:16S rRNA G966 N2-methylase RsmD
MFFPLLAIMLRDSDLYLGYQPTGRIRSKFRFAPEPARNRNVNKPFSSDAPSMSRKLSYIDLFAGCGGLSTGLYLAGFKGVFAVEKNATAFSTLKANLIKKRKHFNWPNWLAVQNWDIEKLIDQKREELKKLKGTIDLIVGGPPCQGFSTAGRRREADTRNHALLMAVLDLIAAGQVTPKHVLWSQELRSRFSAYFKEVQELDDDNSPENPFL